MFEIVYILESSRTRIKSLVIGDPGSCDLTKTKCSIIFIQQFGIEQTCAPGLGNFTFIFC